MSVARLIRRRVKQRKCSDERLAQTDLGYGRFARPRLGISVAPINRKEGAAAHQRPTP